MTSSTDGPDQGDPAAWGVDIPGMGFGAQPDEATARAVAAAYASQGATLAPLYRAPGAVAAAPPDDEEQDPDGPAKAVREVLTGGVRSDDLPWEQVTPAQVDHYRAVAAAARAVPLVPPAGHEDEPAAPPGDEAGVALARVRHVLATPVAGPDELTALHNHIERLAEAALSTTPPGEDEVELLARVIAEAEGGGVEFDRDCDPDLGDGEWSWCNQGTCDWSANAEDREQYRSVARAVLTYQASTSPAGHEDEAAVERAARALHHAVSGAPGDLTWDDWRDRARAVLAAARGPRTPDGPATN